MGVKYIPARNASPASYASRSDAGWHIEAGGHMDKNDTLKTPIISTGAV